MANINQVSLCPKCNSEAPKGDKVKCAVCGYQYPYKNTSFGTPDYLSSQYKEEVEKLGKDSRDHKHDQDALSTDLFNFFINMSDDDRAYALEDSIEIMSTLILSNTAPAAFGNLIKLGKRIGELANSADSFIKSGGKLNGIFDTAQPRVSRKDPFQPGGERDLDSER